MTSWIARGASSKALSAASAFIAVNTLYPGSIQDRRRNPEHVRIIIGDENGRLFPNPSRSPSHSSVSLSPVGVQCRSGSDGVSMAQFHTCAKARVALISMQCDQAE